MKIEFTVAGLPAPQGSTCECDLRGLGAELAAMSETTRRLNKAAARARKATR